MEERDCLHARAKKKRHKLIRTAKYSHFSESFANCWSCNLLDLCNNGFDLHFYLPLHWSLLYHRASMESHGSASKMHSVSVVSYAISLTWIILISRLIKVCAHARLVWLHVRCGIVVAIAIAAVASIAVHRKFETAMKITRLAHTILRSRVESTQNFACQL